MHSFFITGTGTHVGKTWIAASLVRHLRSVEIPALGLKPLACGNRGDVEALAKAGEETLSLNEINPVYIPAPLAPYAASVLEERVCDLDPFWKTWHNLQSRHPGPFFIEGAGGWLVPITRQYWMRDFARELGLPVMIVASASLGTLNHTLLTLESIRACGLEIAGIFLNSHGCPDDLATRTNGPILEELAACPVTRIESGEEISSIPRWMT